MADQLAHKNVTIQACRKLFHENRILKEEYEKLLRTEISFLEEKSRSEAMAATLRLKNIFGESWNDKKNRILGNFEEYTNNVKVSNGTSSSSEGSNNKNNNSENNNNDINNNNDNNNINSSGSNGSSSSSGSGNTNLNLNFTLNRNVLDDSSDEESENEEDYWPARSVISFIVKSNDDLRQEVCCLQLMRICDEIFGDYNLKNQLYLKPYRILSTGNSTGLVQVLTDTLSLDALKKTPGFIN